MRPFAVIAVLFLAVAAAARADEAPYGLHWGETAQDITDRGLSIEAVEGDGKSKLYVARGLRMAPPDTGLVRIVINEKHGLQRITWISKPIEDDLYGTKGRKAYQDRIAAFNRDFGRPHVTTEEIGVSVYTAPDQFYACLATDGCGIFMSKWLGDDEEILLRLVADAPTRGRLEIIYDGPDWDDILSERRAKPK